MGLNPEPSIYRSLTLMNHPVQSLAKNYLVKRAECSHRRRRRRDGKMALEETPSFRSVFAALISVDIGSRP